MELKITKGARQYGYLIWNSKTEESVEEMLQSRNFIHVRFNGFDLGEKHIDWKYHRISLGYKLTRALSPDHTMFSVICKDGFLEVTSHNGKQ